MTGALAYANHLGRMGACRAVASPVKWQFTRCRETATTCGDGFVASQFVPRASRLCIAARTTGIEQKALQGHASAKHISIASVPTINPKSLARSCLYPLSRSVLCLQTGTRPGSSASSHESGCEVVAIYFFLVA